VFLEKNIFPLSPVELTGNLLTNIQCAANVTISFMMHQSFIIHILTLTIWHQCIGAATIKKLQNLNTDVKCMCFTPVGPVFHNYIGAANRMQHVA
jgi:hypothetical protein